MAASLKPLSDLPHFIFVYHISLVKVQTNYCNNNIPLTLDVKQLNKTIKRYYFHNFKALWDGKSKTKMYYGIFRIKKQLSGKKSVAFTVASTIGSKQTFNP